MIKQKVVIDQLGRKVEVDGDPQRLVSLVPSITELLAVGFGMEEQVVGVTDYCIHPASLLKNKVRLGGPKTIDVKKLQALAPQLVIASKEENTREQVLEMATFVPVYVADVKSKADAFEAMLAIGRLLRQEHQSQQLIAQIKSAFAALPKVEKRHSAAYLVWKEPFIAVGADTFVHDMLLSAGFSNVFASHHTQYPATSFNEIAALRPQYVLLSSEPYPFSDEHKNWFEERLPGVEIVLVDGEMFSWYGVRMAKAPAYFEEIWELAR
ncbi:MAG: hypothetical protein B6243_03000 [Anaerolineaceae bacterium 4572_5.2]|nr:MAG: hypothetical protein B6243_03000 [Anaerolineaceae bacterium 4572_5.2]